METTNVATTADSTFFIIFHFCYTSMLIFKMLMLLYEILNFSKDQ